MAVPQQEKYFFDEDDPFNGKAVLWRRTSWNRCYFCSKEKPHLICKSCGVVAYCNEECEIGYLEHIHTASKCFVTKILYDSLVEKPILIGTDHEKGNCVFASHDVEIGQEIITDNAAAAILFSKNIKNMDPNYIEAGICQKYPGIQDKFIYICNLIVILLRKNKALVRCGYFRTVLLGSDEEKEMIETLAGILSQQVDYIESNFEELLCDISIAYGIAKLSCITIHNKPSGIPLLKGFFPIISLFNHACQPNCDYYCNANGTITIIALSNIKTGEELTIDYMPCGGLANFKTRQTFLNANYYFNCICENCKTGTTPEINGNAICISPNGKTIHAIITDAGLDIVEKIERTAIIILQNKKHYSNHVACCIKTLLQLAIIEFSSDSDTRETETHTRPTEPTRSTHTGKFGNPDLVYEGIFFLQKYANVGLAQMDIGFWQTLQMRPMIYIVCLYQYIRIHNYTLKEDGSVGDSFQFKQEDPFTTSLFFWMISNSHLYIRAIDELLLVCPQKAKMLQSFILMYFSNVNREVTEKQ